MKRVPRPAEWGRLAHLFDEINEHFIDYEAQVEFLLACRERCAPKAQSVLDLGCGTGLHAWRLAEAGLRTVGVDLSAALVRRARRAPPGATARPGFVCGDLTALPVCPSFDLVFALNFVFSFLHTNEAVLGALAEVRRVLSPGGLFILDYHYYFPAREGEALAAAWRERCRVRGQTLIVTHRPRVNWDTQLSTDRMTYQFREGRRVVREVESVEVRRISLPQDLLCILQASGFEVVRHCPRFDLQEEAKGGLGVVVARAMERRRRPAGA